MDCRPIRPDEQQNGRRPGQHPACRLLIHRNLEDSGDEHVERALPVVLGVDQPPLGAVLVDGDGHLLQEQSE